jgi:hypothetical protein
VVEQAPHEVGLVEEEGQVADHLGQHRVVHLVGVWTGASWSGRNLN